MKRVGIDAHVCLHKLAYAHSQSIVIDGDDYKPPLALDFAQEAQIVMGRGIELMFVFNGRPTPAKLETDQASQVRRAKARLAEI